MADKSIQMQRKKADGSFDRYYPLIKETNILADAGRVILTRTDGLLSQVDETVGGVLRRRTMLNRTNGQLSSVTTTLYVSDGATVERQWTETLARLDGLVDHIDKEVSA